MSNNPSTNTIKDTLLDARLKARAARASNDVAYKNQVLEELDAAFDIDKVLNNLSLLFEEYSVLPLPFPANADWRMTET